MLTGYVERKVEQKITLPSRIQNSLSEARRYGKLIVQAEQQCAPNQRKHLTHTVKSANTLLANLDKLEENLVELYKRHNVNRELKQTSYEIEELKQQLQTANDRQAQILNNSINTKQRYLSVLNMLQDFQKRIELTIEQNTGVLKSTYAEIILLVAQGNIDNNSFRRLNQDLQENSASLMDLLEAVEEVDKQSSYMG